MLRPAARGDDDGPELLPGQGEVGVHHQVVVPGDFFDLGLALFQAPGQFPGVHVPPALEAPLQFLKIRRDHENQGGLGETFFQGLGPPGVQVEDQVLAGFQGLVDPLLGGAVAVAELLHPFRQGPAIPKAGKLFGADEKIILARDLPGPGGAGGVGDGKLEARVRGHQIFQQRGLTRARGRGDHEDLPGHLLAFLGSVAPGLALVAVQPDGQGLGMDRGEDDMIAVGDDNGAGFAAVGGVDEALGAPGLFPQALHGRRCGHDHRYHPVGDDGVAKPNVH